MKRSVAIVGPTPQFVRWAIDRDCPLRETDVDNLPDSSFRQLRGLREFSAGLIEGRVFEDICVHPDSTHANSKWARGFRASEILDPVGDAAFVDSCCRSCPANAVAVSRPGTWAGCYGWLPATSGFHFESTLRSGVPRNEPAGHLADRPGDLDIVRVLDDVIAETETADADPLFERTTPRWYGLWKNSTLTTEQTGFLLEVFESATTRCLQNGTASSEIVDLIQFRDALLRCAQQRLTLHVDLVPPGISDGGSWTLAAHCPDCKMEMPSAGRQTCPACGRIGNPHGPRISKVLGLRPYVNLVGVMGEAMTAEFMERFETRP